MGYRDADEFSVGATLEFSKVLDQRPKIAVGSRRAASVHRERVRGARRDAHMDDDSAPRIGTPGRATSMGNASWTQPG